MPLWAKLIGYATLPWWGPIVAHAVIGALIVASAALVGVSIGAILPAVVGAMLVGLAVTYSVRYRHRESLSRTWERSRRGEFGR